MKPMAVKQPLVRAPLASQAKVAAGKCACISKKAWATMGLVLAGIGVCYTLLLSVLAPVIASMLTPALFLLIFLAPSLVLYTLAVVAFCQR